MKRKTTIAYAMTVVIAGLLITTAVGLPTMNEKPAAETKNTDADSSTTSIAALLEKYNIDPTTKTIAKAEQKMSVEKTTVKAVPTAVPTLVELSEEKPLETIPHNPNPSNNRAPVLNHARHPGVGDKHDGNIALSYDWEYFNDTPDPDETFNGLVFTLTDNYGENWTDEWTLVYGGTNIVYPATYPSIDYMDYNDSEGGNVFYATFNELTETFESGGEWYNGTNISFMKIAYGNSTNNISNPDVWVRTWTAFGRSYPLNPMSPKYWHSMAMSDIAAADDFFFRINRTWQPFGLTSFVIDIYSEDAGDPSLDNGCNWFYPIEYDPPGAPSEWIARYGLMWHFIDIDGAQATSATIDKTPNAITGDPEDKKAYAVWDPVGDVPGQHVVLIASTNMSARPGMNDLFHYNYGGEVWDGVSWSMTAPQYSLEYPSIAAGNDGEIVIAQEMVNTSNPTAETMLSLWHCNSSDGNTMNMSTATWLFPNPAYYPEVSHVCGQTYMVHWIMDDKLYAAFSRDGGYSWAENGSAEWIEYYQWSGGETVIEEYRAVELSDEAAWSIWEYDDSTPPTEYSTKLYYTYNTVIVDGNVYDEFGDPAAPDSVKLANLNESLFNYPATLDGNYYHRCLLLGIEIWTDANIIIKAQEGGSVGSEFVTFGIFNGSGRQYSEAEILFRNTFDIQYGDRAARADLDRDGDVDLDDFGIFAACYAGSARPPAAACSPSMFIGERILGVPYIAPDLDDDGDVDLDDFGIFAACYAGSARPPAAACNGWWDSILILA